MTLSVEAGSPVRLRPQHVRVTPHVLREAPVHALMLAIMAVTMLEGSSAIALLGSLVLLAASIACAAFCRTRPFLREHVVDLWAMALVILILLPTGASSGSAHAHVVAMPSTVLFGAIVGSWVIARVWLARSEKGRRTSLLSAAVTAVGLAVMLAFCG